MSTGLSSVRGSSREGSAVEYQAGEEIVKTNPANAVQTVEGVGGDPRRLTAELPGVPLPGHGEAYDDCGDDVVHFCSGCGETHAVGRTCNRKECPRCAPAWVVDRAGPAGAKIEATRRYLAAKRGDSPRFHHLVFSPPEDFAVARDDPLAAGYEIVKSLLDELGTDGGLIVYHPWRGSDGDDRGFWKDVLFEGRGWGETVDRLEYGPHFHVIALGRYVPGERFTKKLYEDTGWTYKRITKGGDNTETAVSLYDTADLARALTYTLSHAGVSEECDAYRYYGRVANFAADDHIEREMDATVRSVAPNTLGLSFGSTSCERELEDEEELPEGSATAPGGGESDEEPDEGPRKCGGKLRHIRVAPRYLRDREWADRVSAGQVAEAYRYWLKGDPPPGG